MTVSQDFSFRDYPEAVALRALGFFPHRAELDRFLASAGIDGEVRQPPVSREVMAKALDFLLENEAALIQFSHAVDLPPEAAYEARRLFVS
jgi:hypothetical protein